MNLRRVLIGIVIVAVLVAGGFLVYRQFIASDPAAEDAAVPEEAVPGVAQPVAAQTGVVSAEGQIVPLRHATLSFEGGGQLAEIAAPEGATVQQGDPILRLDATDQEIALIQAEAALEQAQAARETARAGQTAAQTGVQAAEIGVDAAEVQLALLTADPTEEQLALSESSVAVAEARIAQAAGGRDVVLQGANQSEIQAAEARLRSAEAQVLPVRDALDQLRREDSPDEDQLAQAQARYNAAVANVQAAQAALDELQAGATAAQQQAATGGVAAAAAQRNAAQAELDLLQAGARAEQVQVAEANVQEAEATQAEAELALTRADAAVAQAEAGVVQAEAAVESARDALDRMTLTAPFAGTVAQIDAEVGEVVNAGAPVVRVGDFSGWQVNTTDLTELDVVALEVGAPVEITIDAIPGETLQGTVTRIATTSTLVRGDVTYEVAIRLDDTQDLPLRWGMTVFVNVDVE